MQTSLRQAFLPLQVSTTRRRHHRPCRQDTCRCPLEPASRAVSVVLKSVPRQFLEVKLPSLSRIGALPQFGQTAEEGGPGDAARGTCIRAVPDREELSSKWAAAAGPSPETGVACFGVI